MRFRLFQPVRLATRTAGPRIFIVLAIREGLATVLSQTSWQPYRVPLELLRPLSHRSGRSDEVGVDYSVVTSSASRQPAPGDLVRPLVALSGGQS